MGDFNIAQRAKKHVQEMNTRFGAQIYYSVQNAVIYGPTYMDSNKLFEDSPVQKVVPYDTVKAGLLLSNGKTAILNFASYKYPGGQFMNGSKAQEECICHESTLYNVISQYGDYYEWNKAHNNKHLYLNRALYTPNIIIERSNDKGKWQSMIDVITCAAPNYRAASNYAGVSLEENNKTLFERIKFIKYIAENQNIDTLILGAFGCGVFGQDPIMVANYFKEVFKKSSVKTVYYAILPDQRNLPAFQSVFPENLET